MTYRIAKRWTFDAAHHLEGLPEGHKCSRVHGHTYTVELILRTDAPLAPPGFVIDFAELAPFGEHLAREFDHTDLNESLTGVSGLQPTCEHLAKWFFCVAASILRLPESVRVDAVRVHESSTTWGEYSE